MLALRAMDARRALREELGLLGAVVAGAAIRLDLIREQIVLDDEWHALHRSLEVEMGVDSPDYRVDVAPRIADYRSRYGTPVYKDGTLVVFDVGRNGMAEGAR